MGGSSKPNPRATKSQEEQRQLYIDDPMAYQKKYGIERGGGPGVPGKLPKGLVGVDFNDTMDLREEPEPIAVADTDDADRARGIRRRASSRSKTIITGDLMPEEENLKRKRLLGG